MAIKAYRTEYNDIIIIIIQYRTSTTAIIVFDKNKEGFLFFGENCVLQIIGIIILSI